MMTLSLADHWRLSRGAWASTLLAILLLGSCGSNQVKNQPPLVQVSSWHLDGSTLHARLRIRNVNDLPLEIARLQLTATSDHVPLARYDALHSTEVAATGFETVSLAMSVTAETVALFNSLDEGSVSSIPYQLEGRVETAGGKPLRFAREGHIYTVPGRPGHYR